MEQKIITQTIVDNPELKVFILSSKEPCNGIVHKSNFLQWVRDYIFHTYPGESANFYEESHTDTLSVVVIIGINSITINE